MAQSILYSYLKTIDGEEVMEFTKVEFDNLSKSIKFREVKKSDRTLYFVKDNIHLNNMHFFKNDYFEVLK